MIHQCIVVGSGATGAMAAQTLVDAGLQVTMLDVGHKDEVYRHLTPQKDFLTIRNTVPYQHEFFLGQNFEGIPWNEIRVGAQLTPARLHLVRGVSEWLRTVSNSFYPMESLGYGGLGAAWGCGCHSFSDEELRRCGLAVADIRKAYDTVAARIGISGEQDDAAPYNLGSIRNFQPSFELEASQKTLFERYREKRELLNHKGFFLGRTAIAILSRALGDRKPTSLSDMDFWSDHEKSAYRSWMTVDELCKKSNFTYIGNSLVLRFKEVDGHVRVWARNIGSREDTIYTCKRLVLSPGVLGTARIAMRSLPYQGQKLPLLCNSYNYMPTLRLAQLGKNFDQFKHSMGQLVMFHDPARTNTDAGMAAFFTYRSLLLFKLVKEAPLNFKDGRAIMHYLQSAFLVAGIHHPERPSTGKNIRLIADKGSPTGDVLQINYAQSLEEKVEIAERLRKWKWAFRQLGCLPLKVIQPGFGASIHYAGTLPYSQEDRPFTLEANGRLRGTSSVFVADGSGFTHLPAKGLTLTLMANAHRVGSEAAKDAT